MPNKLHVIVCENLIEEVRTAVEEEHFADVEIVPFAAKCGQAAAGSARLNALVESFRKKNAQVFILGGTCLTGPAKPEGGPFADLRYDVDQCFPLFIGRTAVEELITAGSYLVTSGWVRHWRSALREWGFDQAQARAFFAETMKRIVLLQTGSNPAAEKEGRAFAEYIGLPLIVQPAGLDLLRLHLRNTVLAWRLGNERRRTADLAMLSDLSAELTRVGTEEDAIENIILLFRSLFAPKRILYLPFAYDVPGEWITVPGGERVDPEDLARLRGISGEYAVLETGDGFGLRISHRGETLGLIEVRGFAFPAHRDHYLDLALTVSHIAGLAIANARAYQSIREERDRAEKYLKLAEKSVRERELLLKEVNHRIKNNFQMLAGMLRLQSANLRDPDALAICREMQGRIKSIAFVHERLYKSSDLAAVDFSRYIGQIIKELSEAFRDQAARIHVSTEVEEIGLNINTSIPLGLIINELIANAFKHAFPGDRAGNIQVVLRALPEESFRLEVRDDGVGLPPGFEIGKSDTLGLQLVAMMAEQLDAIVEAERDGGTVFRVVFRERGRDGETKS